MLDDLLIEYMKKFGDGFPTFQVFRGKTEEQSIEMVKRCIETGKDAYELGYCKLDRGIKY